jgi:hypothetical protein
MVGRYFEETIEFSYWWVYCMERAALSSTHRAGTSQVKALKTILVRCVDLR